MQFSGVIRSQDKDVLRAAVVAGMYYAAVNAQGYLIYVCVNSPFTAPGCRVLKYAPLFDAWEVRAHV